ncbi:helix-turn-helix transcriptional regulator [uncultured Oscillibacter sp.]|uniref:helix-turn-helix domain-containing protein n=1 Tax=uncultured Oscillibacter sp. TaxID=876091 RepID=UPI0025FD1444|nr:helix-turn-helix transcriptional regulator [uncultured Oscillibacter sp.]
MPFRENLIAKMQERAITNYRLAKELHIHATTIQNWRDGKQPQLSHAKLVADYFGVTMDAMTK